MLLVGLITAFVVGLCSVYVYYKFVVFNYWRKKGVFYVEPVVPTGNVTPILTGKLSVGELFRDMYLKYKDHRAFGIYTFFKPNLVIADLDLVRIVLTKEFGSFHDRDKHSNEKTDPLSAHLFFLTGKKWRNLRVKLTPTFTSGKLKQMFAVLKECGEEFVKSLEKLAETERCIDIKEMFARYSTDVIMSVAFGIKTNCIDQPDNEVRYWGKKVFKISALRHSIFMFAPQIARLFSISIFDKGVSNFFINMFRDNVEYRKTHNVVRHDFMNLLIQLMENGYVEPDEEKDVTKENDVHPSTSKLSMIEATAQAFVFFLAGFETSSTTATFCLYEIALNQDVQNKLRQEIDEVLKKHGEVTYNAVNDMTYLHKVVSETLRKYPPAPVLSRICTKAINLPTTNIHIPEGTSISIPVLGIQRDPAIYPDPDKFDPERFNEEQIAARHPYAFLPFGEGPRACIGSRFGYMQTKVGILNILSNFKVKLHPRTSVPLIFGKTTTVPTAKGGVHLIIEPR
ncbi:probable cytochrome P450 6a13 [Pseudomyrmex gracilis]|uniref:probable cytochrome P450 6a13 n=1 Tax=Pseudomyrmex gracilis TaxID=219809 RepID=UPI000995CB61|nr:probable cytochrome P450 6a13 [Pseudomyrmex gracilis]XP_020281101.1 probable cytochrome P450 6a13 [Pseudomyrmex gracilis]